MKLSKTVGMSLGTLFAIGAASAVVMQGFVIGSMRYTPADRPVPFWLGVAVLGVLAALFYSLGLRKRRTGG